MQSTKKKLLVLPANHFRVSHNYNRHCLQNERESLRGGVYGELVLAVLSNFAPAQTLRPILRPSGTEHDIT